jgi:hypothetical protein
MDQSEIDDLNSFSSERTDGLTVKVIPHDDGSVTVNIDKPGVGRFNETSLPNLPHSAKKGFIDRWIRAALKAGQCR